MFGTFERDRFVRREGYRERLIDRNVELYLSTFDAVLQFPDSTWCAFEVKYNPDDIETAARQLVKTSKKFVHNPPKALAVIVGKHGIAHRREDGVYVLPLTSLKP